MSNTYQKLEIPKLVELKNDLSFIIATHIDIESINFGILLFKGTLYNYEADGSVEVVGEYFINYHIKEDSYYDLND